MVCRTYSTGRTYLLACIILLGVPPALCQQLVISLNTNDCVRHLSPINALNALDPSVHVTIRTAPNNVRVLPDLLKRFGVDASQFTIAAGAGQNSGLIGQFTTVQGAILSFPFEELSRYVPVLNRSCGSHARRDSLSLPTAVVLSDRVDVFAGEDILAVSDYLTAKVYLLSFPGTVISQQQLALGDELKFSLLKLNGVDTGFYNTHVNMLLAKGLASVTPEAIAFMGDTISMMVGVFFPTLDHEKEVLGMSGSYAQVQVLGSKVIGTRLIDPWVPIDSAYIYTMKHSLASGSGVTMSMAKREHTMSPDHLLSHLILENGKLRFNKFRGLIKPTVYDTTGFYYGLTVGSFNGPIYHMKHYPIIYNDRDDSSLDLRTELENRGLGKLKLGAQETYFCYDAHALTNGMVEVAFRFGGKDLHSLVDLKSSAVLSVEPLDLSGLEKNSIRFLGNGKLVGMSLDRNWIIVM